jgi:HK97 family phage prohead protease
MQHKTIEAQTTVVAEQGWFSAIAAAYTPDRVGDRIIPGAFAATIARWQASGKNLPIHYDHKGNPEFIVGHVSPGAMREIEQGLYIEGQLDIEESETARAAWRSVKANRMSLSFGYLAEQHKGADGLNHLTEIDLFEISLTPSPVQSDTRFLATKSLSPEQQERLDRELEAIHRHLHHSGRFTQEAEPVKHKAQQPTRVASFDA